MAGGDFGFSVAVTQDLLGLPNLNIDDDLNFEVGKPFFGGQVQWNRTQITGPFTDGATTTHRSRQMVTEPVTVYCRGGDINEAQANQDAVIEAFVQDHFNIAVVLGNTLWQYECEAADYTITWDTPYAAEGMAMVVFAVPRQPIPIIGGSVPVPTIAATKAETIIGWAQAQAWAIISATRDANDAITTATIQWPDGTPGVFTTDHASSTFLGLVDAWHATYGSPTVNTYTQALVTRDVHGGVTAQPPIAVS